MPSKRRARSLCCRIPVVPRASSSGRSVTGEKDSGIQGREAVLHSLLFGLILLLPGVDGSLFGWMHFIVPLAVFFYLYKWENGLVYVSIGLALAVVASLIIGSFWMLIFTSALIPPGYTLAHAAFRSNTPAMSGFRATLALVVCWGVLLIGQAMLSGTNPITGFLTSLDLNIASTLSYYRQNTTISADTMALIEQSFHNMQVVLPRVLVSLLLSFALAIIWLTMIIGNRFVLKFAGYRPWSHHRLWELPDRLIWLLICAAVISMLPLGLVRLVGVNVLVVLCLLYFFQGFSIFSFFLHKWGVPQFLRFLLYGMMLFQSFGTALLLVVGIGDVWFDLRRLKPRDKGPENNSDG